MLSFCGSFLEQHIKLSVRKYPCKRMQNSKLCKCTRNLLNRSHCSALSPDLLMLQIMLTFLLCTFSANTCIFMESSETYNSIVHIWKAKQPRTNGVTPYFVMHHASKAKRRGPGRALNPRLPGCKACALTIQLKGPMAKWLGRMINWSIVTGLSTVTRLKQKNNVTSLTSKFLFSVFTWGESSCVSIAPGNA